MKIKEHLWSDNALTVTFEASYAEALEFLQQHVEAPAEPRKAETKPASTPVAPAPAPKPAAAATPAVAAVKPVTALPKAAPVRPVTVARPAPTPAAAPSNGRIPDPWELGPHEPEPTPATATPAAQEAPAGDASGDVKIELTPELTAKVKLRDVVDYLMAHGVNTKQGMIDALVSLKPHVTALKKIEDLADRAEQAAEVMGLE